jgi:hypothetical protein
MRWRDLNDSVVANRRTLEPGHVRIRTNANRFDPSWHGPKMALDALGRAFNPRARFQLTRRYDNAIRGRVAPTRTKLQLHFCLWSLILCING